MLLSSRGIAGLDGRRRLAGLANQSAAQCAEQNVVLRKLDLRLSFWTNQSLLRAAFGVLVSAIHRRRGLI